MNARLITQIKKITKYSILVLVSKYIVNIPVQLSLLLALSSRKFFYIRIVTNFIKVFFLMSILKTANLWH